MKLIEIDKPLPHAEHAFGTASDAEKDVTPDDVIRAYTETLGPIAHMRQVHSDRIVYADSPGLYEEADAIFTDHDNLWIAVKTADCVPVLISTPHAVAAVHCGWRGIQAGLMPKVIKLLIEEYGDTAVDTYIHIGPSISQQNYEVEDHYKDMFDEKFFKPSKRKGYVLMDMVGILIDQARELSVPIGNIADCGLCTYHEKDMFHSYRRNKHEGKDGYNVQLSLVKRAG